MKSLKDVEGATNLANNIEDLADELREDNPTQSRVNKWVTRITQTIEAVKLSSDMLENINTAIASAKLLMTSFNQ